MRCLGLLCLMLIAIATSEAKAQDNRILERGDAVVTGFSGTTGNPPDQTYTYNLRLEKRPLPNACVAGGLGFLCDYVLRVTNRGPDPYIGPIVVNDELPASPAGAVITVADAPPWICFAISPAKQQCTYGPGALLAGESIDLNVTVDLPVAAPVCHLDSKASLVWPWGQDDADPSDDFDLATATIPAPHCPSPSGEKTNLQISKHPLKEVCADKGPFFECPYQVTVRNIGAGVYNGLIQIDDTIPAGATATFAPAAWNCMGPPPSYSCQKGPVVLLPGQAVNMNTIVKVPKNLAGALACAAKTAVKIAAGAGGTDQNTDLTDDDADATMILPGEVAECPGLPKLSNLKLETTGPDGECPVLWGNWMCQFKVTVQNFGKPYTSPVQFIDVLPFGDPSGAVVSFKPPTGWTCGGPVLFPNLYQCSNDNPDLAHLEKVEIPVIVRIPVAPEAKCEVTNSAEIVKAPGGTLLNAFDDDDAGSAKARLSARVGQSTCLSDLKLTNSGPSEACPVSGDSWECQFKIGVQNFGKTYKSPIQFVDRLPLGAPDGATLSFQPPAGWNCDGPVQSDLYRCSSNNPDLEHGETVEIPVTVRIPVAPTAKCAITNTAEIVRAAGESPQNILKVDDEGSAEAQLAPVFPVDGSQGICLTSNLRLEVTDRNQSFGGFCPAKDGNWICHFGLKVTNIGEEPFEGAIQIVDALPRGVPAGARVTFEETPGWDCGEPETGSDLYKCGTKDAVLGKGEGNLIRGTIRIPIAPVQKCAITNNGKIVSPERSLLNTLRSDDSAAVTMALQRDVVLPGGQVACASKQSNLKLEKSPWLGNNKFCQISDGMWVCDWKLRITNTGPDSFESPIEFDDELVGPPPGASLSLNQPANWTCNQPGSPHVGCRSENPKLGAGESVEFSTTAWVPLGPVAECAVKNYARIVMPKARTALNAAWLDDISSSTLRLSPYLPSDDPNSPGICLLSATGESEPQLAAAEGQTNNLAITKTAAESQVTATGQSTKFTITVANEGPAVFNAPIEIRDTLFDGVIVEPSNGGWSAPWVCEGQSAVGHPEQWICTHPAVQLGPGENVTLELEIEAPDSFIASSGAVKCGYDNKVEILRPASGSPKNADAGDDVTSAEVKFVPFERRGKKFCGLGPTTPERPQTNLTIAKTVGDCAATTRGQNCTFAITVTNAGTHVYNGSIEIRDTLFDGAIVEPSNGSWSAPWTCEGQSAIGHPEQGICTHPPVKLDPGDSVVLNLEIEAPDSFVVPSASQARCGYKNKVEILDPAGGSSGNMNAGDDTAFVEAKFPPFERHGRTFCAPLTNLTVANTAGACATRAGGQNCLFTITVTNKGPNAYGGPIEIRDTLFDGQIVEPSNGSFSAPWTCKGLSAAGHPEQRICTHPPVKLNPGESAELKLEAEAPDRFVVPSDSQARCGYKNKVEILDPAGGSDGNTKADDDTAFAEAKFPPFEKHGRAFCGLPTNLAVEKTAGACATTASGQNCSFAITVTNKGPNAYKGPIEIRDTLFDGQIVEPSNGSWPMPWTCEGQSAAGHPEQRVCAHPPVKLDPGESVVLNLKVEAPNSFVAGSGSQARCGYTNKVELLDPAGGTNWNMNAGDDAASAKAKFAPFEMHGTPFCGFVLPTPPAKPAEKRTCPANSVGEYPDCRCPTGFAGSPPNCREIAVREACKGGMERIDGECQCPRGMRLLDGKCRTPSAAPEKTCGVNEVGIYPDCHCLQGFTWSEGPCAAEGPKTCPADSVGEYPDCRCKRGTVGRSGNCVRIIVPKKCPADSVGFYPKCRCKRGTTGEPGNCSRISKSKRCPAGFRGTPPRCRRA